MSASNQSFGRIVFVHERFHEYQPLVRGIQNALKFLYCLRSDVLDGCLMKPAVTRPETPR